LDLQHNQDLLIVITVFSVTDSLCSDMSVFVF